MLQQLRPHLDAAALDRISREGHAEGLRFTLALEGGGRCLAVAGWRLMTTTWLGRKLYVDDLVTAEEARSSGVGRALLRELVARARAHGCTALDLDSGVVRAGAHRFYMREGLTISAFHFTTTFE